MRENNRELIEMISKMEKASEWPIVLFLLELVQFRSQASRKWKSGDVTKKRPVDE